MVRHIGNRSDVDHDEPRTRIDDDRIVGADEDVRVHEALGERGLDLFGLHAFALLERQGAVRVPAQVHARIEESALEAFGVGRVRILPASQAEILPQFYFTKLEYGTEVTA
jgi:hypothetical protein